MPYGRDDEEQHVLSLVAQLRAGGMSVRAIVAHLEAHGVGRTK
jgi:transposase-like protein